MLKNLPSSMIDTATLKQERDGKPFYYHVKFTVFGELLEVEDDISDLPDIAQKLILGNKKEATITDLKKGLGNLKYIIPLIALGEIYQLPDWLKPVEVVLQKLQKNLPEEIKKNPNNYISSDWVKDLIEAKRYNFTDQASTSMQFVNYLLGEDLLLNIPSIFDHEILVASQPLLETLEENWEDRKLATTILNALKKSKHPDALKKFIAIFTHPNKLIDYRIVAGRGLANFDFYQVKETLFHALMDKNHWIRIQAVKSLRPFIKEEEVVNTLIGVFRHDKHQWVKVRAIENLGFTKNNKKVIRLLANELKAKTNEEICFHSVQALKRINSKEANFVLRQYWY